ncbi:uncharacterized protein PF3D7_1120000-like [Procambarus clarkii]|uniref:uncharacterized protein PF3D7_1120000-like n=1 Tax=Procambarus clarkii TaxID=6728 RepID=UPI003742AACD
MRDKVDVEATARHLSISQDIRKGGVIGRLEIIEDMQKKYEKKCLNWKRAMELSGVSFALLKGNILQQEEVNKELEKYKEEIKEMYAQVVKEKETIKEVCLEVKTRNDKQEADLRQAIRKELVTNSKLEATARHLSISQDIRKGGVIGRLEIIEDMQKKYEKKCLNWKRAMELSGVSFALLKGNILQQEEVNKELEKYKEEIKEMYAQVVKEKETIKEVCLEVKTRNDKQEADLRQAIRKELVTNSKLVQNTADSSKFIIIFGSLEKEISSRVDRAAEEMKIIEKIIGLEDLNSKEHVGERQEQPLKGDV